MNIAVIGRRAVLLTGAIAAAGPALAQAAPIARTKAGQVRGRMMGAIYAFQGVRYGASTVGHRFEPPRPPEPWTGVADATHFANMSPQLGADRPAMYASWTNVRPESEDCLFLNVYTPGLRDGKKRPVMVWLHGGGYTSGSSHSLYAVGDRLAHRGDVVVVTVNHRLNAFGYLYLAHLDPKLADSGNVGQLDIVQALHWVRDNAAEFGGDPGNVTIFGQSGGGGKVSTLMATPPADGLFHRAIVQSGSGITAITVDQAKASTAKVMAALKLAPNDVAGLRRASQAQISQALGSAGANFGPVVDGRSLPRHPFEPDAPAISKSVPLLVGTAKDETRGLVGGRDESLFHISWDDLPKKLTGQVGKADIGKTVTVLRSQAPKDSAGDIYFTATTEYRFRRRAIVQAERKAAQARAGGAPAYMYFVAWNSPVSGGKWRAPHSIEHAFVFDNVAVSASMVGSGPDQQTLADAMSSAWTRFARSGNPGWPAYNPQTRPTMVFNTVSRVVNDPRKAEREVFQQA
jgi:para-nitrobenzyl esterase